MFIGTYMAPDFPCETFRVLKEKEEKGFGVIHEEAGALQLA